MFNIVKFTHHSLRSLPSYQLGLQHFGLPSRIRGMSSAPTYTADYLKAKLEKELEASYIEIEDLSNCGCGMKFDATLVSPKFEGKSLLQRQRLVNQVLDEEMKHIHAFTMRTLTPEKWQASRSNQA